MPAAFSTPHKAAGHAFQSFSQRLPDPQSQVAAKQLEDSKWVKHGFVHRTGPWPHPSWGSQNCLFFIVGLGPGAMMFFQLLLPIYVYFCEFGGRYSRNLLVPYLYHSPYIICFLLIFFVELGPEAMLPV